MSIPHITFITKHRSGSAGHLGPIAREMGFMMRYSARSYGQPLHFRILQGNWNGKQERMTGSEDTAAVGL